MIRTLKQLTMVRSSMSVNVFLYYLKRIWVIGKRIPDSVYGNRELKQILTVFSLITEQTRSILGIILYLLFFVVFPLTLFDTPIEQRGDYIITILFFLTCISGSLQESIVFKVTREKHVCIHFMKMDAELYTKTYFLWTYGWFFLWYFFCILVLFRFSGGTLLQGFGFWVVMVMTRAMGEAFNLWFFDKKGVVLCRNNGWAWSLIIGGLLAAYGSLFLRIPVITAGFLLHPAVFSVIVVLGSACAFYVLKGYGGYGQKLHRTVEAKWIASEMIKDAKETQIGSEVGVKEKDLKEGAAHGLEKLEGYEYFNKLFFLRHRRQLLRPIYYRLIFIGILLSIGIIVYIQNQQIAYGICAKITEGLPILVFIMYVITVADKACKAMFYNCDKSMLKFGFYRTPEAILTNFKIRLKKIAGYNLVVGAALCLAVILLRMICKVGIFDAEMILFCAAVLMLSVFFTVHHLFLYYVFQPYSEEMNVKNPFFKGINMAVYVASFICLKIQTGGLAFTVGVLIVTILYVTAALILVYKYAPKAFRVK